MGISPVNSNDSSGMNVGGGGGSAPGAPREFITEGQRNSLTIV